MSETEQMGATRSSTDVDQSAEATDEESIDVLKERAEGQVEDAVEDVGESTHEEIRLDVIFDILKNQRRRHVLRYLRENETTTLSELAEHVAALENDKDVRSLTSSERKRVYVGLYQCHLPRMNDAGVIDFDSDRGRIELKESADQLDEYLETEDATVRPWPLYYLSISLGGGAVYAAIAALLGPQSIVSLLVVPVIVLAIATCALFQRGEMAEDEDE